MEWKLAEAKNKLSEVVTRAGTEGPQWITRHGEKFVMLSEKDYLKLAGDKPSLVEYLLNNTPSFEGVDLTRDKTPMRDPGL